MKQKRTIFVLFAAGLALAGCGGGNGSLPSDQAAEALKQAQHEIDGARESINAMREGSLELQQRIDHQRSELDALIKKRVALYRQQLETYEQRLQRFPAAKENELKQNVVELQQRLEAIANGYRSYSEAEPQKSDEALRHVEDALAEFNTAYKKLQSQIQPT